MDLITRRFGLPMFWGLYLPNLGLVFNVKCSITITISFVFYVAHEDCKYMSPVLWKVDWGLYFSNLGLVFTVKYSIIILLAFT